MGTKTSKRRARLSRPKEHGGLVTLAGAGLVAVAAAPEPLRALVAGATLALCYMARGPVEQLVRGARRRMWDLPALFIFAAAVAAAGIFLAQSRPAGAALVLAIGLSLPVAGAMARRVRAHRSFVVEMGGMAVCGASAGASAYAGGASLLASVALTISMGAYAAAAVAIVRCETRKRGEQRLVAMAWFGVFALALGAATSALILPALAFAFAPRILHAVVRAMRGHPSLPIHAVAARESAELAVFVAVVAVIAAAA